MAVYTKISNSDIKNIVSLYDIGEFVELSPISDGINNSNYKLLTNKSAYLLTVIEDKSLSSDNLKFITNLMLDLAKNNIPTPKPILDKQGNIIIQYQEKPLIITSFLQGKHIRDLKEFNRVEIIGEYLAKMHIASEKISYNRKNPLAINDMITDIDKYLKNANKFQEGLADKIKKSAKYIQDNWQNDLPAGIIHADLFPDNVLFDEDYNLTGILDFYLSGYDIFAYDLAICVNAWCFEDGLPNLKKVKNLLLSYDNIRKLTNKEIENFQILLQAASLRFLLSRIYEWFTKPKDALVTPHNPQEYIDRLKYHQENNLIGKIL